MFSKNVQRFLIKTIKILFEKNYFGFRESAIQYVDKIILYIEERVKNKNYKTLSPDDLKSKGTYYIKYEANKTTTWYILFDQFKENYYINYIFNNHQEEAKFLK